MANVLDSVGHPNLINRLWNSSLSRSMDLKSSAGTGRSSSTTAPRFSILAHVKKIRGHHSLPNPRRFLKYRFAQCQFAVPLPAEILIISGTKISKHTWHQDRSRQQHYPWLGSRHSHQVEGERRSIGRQQHTGIADRPLRGRPDSIIWVRDRCGSQRLFKLKLSDGVLPVFLIRRRGNEYVQVLRSPE